MKLDDFEGESYSWQCVAVELGEGGGTVRAHVYVWQGGVDVLVPLREWRFEWFRDGRLQDWLDLFEGMEMVGEGWWVLPFVVFTVCFRFFFVLTNVLHPVFCQCKR